MLEPRSPTAAASGPRPPRRWARVALGAALGLTLVACSQPRADLPPATNGPTVVGLYEFTFDGIGTGAVTASVRRIDDGIGSLAIVGTTPATGIRSIGQLSAGSGTAPNPVPPAAGGTYVWAEFEIANDNPVDVVGLTFLGYASATDGIDGTAFSAVENASGAPLPARNVRPAGQLEQSGAGNPANRRVLLELTSPAGFRMSAVAYTEGEIAALNAALSGLSFVNTVFPYGFAATAMVASDSSRTIPANGSGRLFVAFRSTDAISRVVWRAVAVSDDRVRIASPQIYNHRLFQGFDDFVKLAGQLAASNPSAGTVQAVVMGAMHDGTRLLPSGVCSDFDFVELADVRVAGGYTGSPAHYWIGGTAANTALTKVADANGPCNP